MSYNDREYQYNHISAPGQTQVFTGRGTLYAIVVNTTASGAISIGDATSGTATQVGVLKASVAENTYVYNAVISTGLRVSLAGASDITVLYTKG